MGAIFLSVWSDNLIKGFYSPSGWADFVQNYADTTKVGLYADLLDKAMIPNAALFASGQFVIEFVVFGLFLVLGVFTPVSALLAALFQLNLLVATSGTTDWPGTYIIMAAAAAGGEPLAGGSHAGAGRPAGETEPGPAAAGLLTAAERLRPEAQQAQTEQAPEDVADGARRPAPRAGDLGRPHAPAVARLADGDARAGETRLHHHLGRERVGALLEAQGLQQIQTRRPDTGRRR